MAGGSGTKISILYFPKNQNGRVTEASRKPARLIAMMAR
jgi:hypothetical protein